MRVCPNCNYVDRYKAEDETREDWWCDRCLRLRITDMLDDLAEIRPQRPAMSRQPVDTVEPL